MERLGVGVARELDRFGPLSGLAPLVEAWPAAVGPEIARNAWPARIARDGTLHIHTSSAAWAFELAQLQERIRGSLGPVAPPRFRFAVGPLPEPAAAPETFFRKPVVPSTRHLTWGAELAAQIDDENLRKVVAKAAAMSLARADSDRVFW